ncbi:Putative acyl-CoA dehydrogenase AidB [Defluviimonas aquaemixtae]|uniref:Acyl-CoA dehydrogenase AidB n=1 Tax=Albidovulum aquaemixtae TaxID=1542388 RepID=A0A2R8B526_9RHOB|nr:acyl-CoA dehydrogenase family protein [Defluviimonas aquaemixtae]SPH17640.1 Putative acyl-CoA dehydrogenase AidB [Defluviimonas aquaemixtae]
MTRDTLAPRSELPTHDVSNQPGAPPCADLWVTDIALRGWLEAFGGATEDAARLGRQLADPQIHEAAENARHHPPELVTFDRAGRRLDEVAFHPGYHRVLALGLEAGYAALPWEGKAGGHLGHAAILYMFGQVEPGIACPLTMTYAGVPALAADPALEAIWRPRLTSRDYDPSLRPISEKKGATLGMAMTEKQGGSDLRGTSTRAEPDGGAWRLTGHKWFCSAPMSDGFLTLAQTAKGLTCFLVPRWLPDGRNAIQLMRLKNKLGNHANASSEIEYHGALAHRLGEEGRGVATIIEMVHHTRLDTAVAPAGLMRAALGEALWWTDGRSAFQRRLIDQPLMRAVLADLVLDWEGALALAMRVAHAFDGESESDRAFARIAVALAKFLNNKRTPTVIVEAMEILGGMGFVEETPMPMLYREAPLNGIWEGSGNVICLDILRTLAKEPLAAETLMAELDAAKGADRRYDAALASARERWPGHPDEAEARWFAETFATLLAASVLLRHVPAAVADGFVATRVAGQRGQVMGSVDGLDTGTILSRLRPEGQE